MSFIFYILFFILGMIIGSIGVVQILLIIFFSIPYTNKMNRLGIIKDKEIVVKRNIITVLIWAIIISAVSFLIWRYSLNNLIVYAMGIVLTLFISIGKVGENKNNISDYFNLNYELVEIDALSTTEISDDYAKFILDIVNAKYLERISGN